MYEQQGGRRFGGGGGLGMPLALGVGGGLAAGFVGAELIDHLEENEYQQGYQNGSDHMKPHDILTYRYG